ncbi:hypothetical protein ABIC16_000739 [Sphingomonas sp. PvP055]|uniref:hypothetical protein n=1 Tax=Sphingomonas sp. PvP055 TaxID=3156391 RepID=UPI003393ECF2
MKLALSACLALALLTPTVAIAQDLIHWDAPAIPSDRTASFPMGTPVRLATRAELNTKDVRAGDRFYLEVAEPIAYRGQVVVPVGAIAVGEVMRAERNGLFGKKGELDVRLLSIQTPSGPVRLSGRTGRKGLDQGVLAIGGALVIAWPMMFIHGTSGRLPADTLLTGYLAEDLRFSVAADAQAASALSDGSGSAERVLPARFDPAAFSATQR